MGVNVLSFTHFFAIELNMFKMLLRIIQVEKELWNTMEERDKSDEYWALKKVQGSQQNKGLSLHREEGQLLSLIGEAGCRRRELSETTCLVQAKRASSQNEGGDSDRTIGLSHS